MAVVVDRVLAVAPVEDVGVGAGATHDPVVASASVVGIAHGSERKVLLPRLDQVIPGAALNRVVGVVPIGDVVVAVTAAQHVGARAFVGDHVITGTTFKHVASTVVVQVVVTVTTVNGVVAVPRRNGVVAAFAVGPGRIRPQSDGVCGVRSGHRHRAHMRRCPRRAIRKLHLLDAVVAVVPVLDGDLVGCGWVVRVVDFDKQVVAHSGERQVAGRDARAKHQFVLAAQREVPVVMAVVVDRVLAVASVKDVGVRAGAALDSVVASATVIGVEHGAQRKGLVVSPYQIIPGPAFNRVAGEVPIRDGVVAVTPAKYVGPRTLV